MRIIDWSSVVCASDLGVLRSRVQQSLDFGLRHRGHDGAPAGRAISGLTPPDQSCSKVNAMRGQAGDRDKVAAIELAHVERLAGTLAGVDQMQQTLVEDRKSTRLNSSH